MKCFLDKFKHILYKYFTKTASDLYRHTSWYSYPKGTLGSEIQKLNVQLAEIYLELADSLYRSNKQ